MLASLDQACGGSAQLVRLVGEAGIGKSRLVKEFVARVGDDDRFQNVAVRQAACSPLGERSYGASGAVVRSAAGMMQNDSAGRNAGEARGLADRPRPAGRGGGAADAAALPRARPRRPQCHLAACRARAVAAANPLRGPHNHRTAAGLVAAVDCRRRPALGRCRVARGATFRHGQAGTHAVDAGGHASSGAGERPARTQAGSATRRSGCRRSAAPTDAACWRRCSAKAGQIPQAGFATRSSTAPAATPCSSRRSCAA